MVDGHCFYRVKDGQHFPSSWARHPAAASVETQLASRRIDGGWAPREEVWDGGGDTWQGMQGANEGDTIGLLLDFDTRTLTIFKNGERLGVMATSLEGEYCWAVSIPTYGYSIRIESSPAPAAPTTAELAQAISFEAKETPRRAAFEAKRALRREKEYEDSIDPNTGWSKGSYFW
eukprot:SAG22_NODE_5088_length_1089_cov_0.817172_1_plen_175_part_00